MIFLVRCQVKGFHQHSKRNLKKEHLKLNLLIPTDDFLKINLEKNYDGHLNFPACISSFEVVLRK